MAASKRGRRTKEERARLQAINEKNERILNEMAEQAMKEKALIQMKWKKGKVIDMVNDIILEVIKYEDIQRGKVGVIVAEGKGDKVKASIKLEGRDE